jgi:hypothetical protein
MYYSRSFERCGSNSSPRTALASVTLTVTQFLPLDKSVGAVASRDDASIAHRCKSVDFWLYKATFPFKDGVQEGERMLSGPHFDNNTTKGTAESSVDLAIQSHAQCRPPSFGVMDPSWIVVDAEYARAVISSPHKDRTPFIRREYLAVTPHGDGSDSVKMPFESLKVGAIVTPRPNPHGAIL